MWWRQSANVLSERSGSLTEQKPKNSVYLDTLVQYFEEEVMGEAYFYGLAEHFDKSQERKKLALMARVERFAAESVHPLLEKYMLTSRSEPTLKTMGEAWVQRHRDFEWIELMTDISIRYQGYLVQFHALEDMAPEEDLPALNTLTEHEVVAIEFANLEIAGDPDSVAPLQRYLTKTHMAPD